MKKTIKKLGKSIVPRLMVTIGLTLSVSLSAWAYFDIKRQNRLLHSLSDLSGLDAIEASIQLFQTQTLIHAFIVLVFALVIIFFLILWFVNRPVRKLIEGTRLIAKGEYHAELTADTDDEMGQLATAISKMGREIAEKQVELNRQRDEYQTLFKLVPCIITVQNKDYRLVKYNREFEEKFAPRPGDYCYWAYKGRNEKCETCPVEKTFEDGKSHTSEETGFYKDGSVAHWIVNTSPIKNEQGEIVAVIEMIMDITHRKQLEEELEKSEKKYYAIFNNIPNPVFVLDQETLEILDCNQRVSSVYGYPKKEILNTPFMDLFDPDEREQHQMGIHQTSVINQAKHIHRDGNVLFVDIWISPSEYPGQKILLVTTNDITKRIETEQQLSHASKMATLGQMATGVAHELNQPLTVIKTLSSFFMKAIDPEQDAQNKKLHDISQKINSNVDRASKIINHMRQFARKSEITLEPVQINEVLEKSIDMFSQQLKVRGISVIWDIEDDLPVIMADAGRLEQVFINLLVNARDAIEQKASSSREEKLRKTITLTSRSQGNKIIIEVSDTGTGIDDTVAGKMFEPFFTTKEVGEGTGLGLSISYGIVKDFGGDIEAVPQKEGGACFQITLPTQEKREP